MRIVESSDGTVKVVELDSSRKYIVVADDNAIIGPIRLREGSIIWKRQGTEIQFVENSETLTS